MMEVICNKCGKIYQIDDNKLKKKVSKLSCSECKQVIVVEKNDVPPKTAETSSYTEINTVHNKASTNEWSSVPSESEPQFPAIQQSVSVKQGKNPVYFSPPKDIVWYNRIHIKTAVIIFCLTTIIMFILGFINYNSAKNNINDEISRLADITTTRLAKYLAEPFWSLNHDMLIDLIKAEMMYKHSHAILIRNISDNNVFMGRKRQDETIIDTKTADIQNRNLTSRRMVITRDNVRIGVVEVYLTTEFMHHELQQSAVKIIITAFLFNLILCLAIYIILKKTVTVPMMDLSRAVDQISIGNHEADITIRTGNEISILSQSIEQMRNNLKAS